LTLHQGEAFAILGIMLVLFASDRIRYDLVAGLALIAAALTGIVPAGKAFDGFSNPVIIIIASVLVLSRAIAISGVVEIAIRRVLKTGAGVSFQVAVLAGSVAGLSAFMKNVGTLGIFMPIAIQTAERSKRPPSLYLMPLAFGSLVGGTMTLIGTGPNLLISTVREQTEGKPFNLFDFTPVGLPLTIVAIVFLAFGWRLIPKDRRGPPSAERQFEVDTYTSEATIPAASPMAGKTVRDLEQLGDGSMTVTSIVGKDGRRNIPDAHWPLSAGDVVVMQADPVALKPIVDDAQLVLHGADEVTASDSKDDTIENVEAVIGAESAMVGETLRSLRLRRRFGCAVLAISRAGQRIKGGLPLVRLQAGDLIVLQGRKDALPETLAALGCLPLADRGLGLGRKRRGFYPLVILLAVMTSVALGWIAADVAFFAAAVAVVLFKLITPKEAYEAIDWPVVVMLGSLIPVGEALNETGASGLIASFLDHAAGHLPDRFALCLILVVSMLVTPFLHHAAAVLVMGPVAFTLAHDLHYQPDAFLMAVALGASSDFLSPIGHQNNALVMSPGGYRFGDYWRLGLPLSVIVAAMGTWLIPTFWPLR
jgi:di/tricarboxylate transporter